MGKHRSKEERLAEQQAWMREQQRKRKEAELGGAAVVQTPPAPSRSELRRKRKDARLSGAAILQAAECPQAVTPLPVQKLDVPLVVGYTFGLPLPPRTRREVRTALRKHRGPSAPAQPPCRCGQCGRCQARVSHTQAVQRWRQKKAQAVQHG
jgi:hypothetical protein